LFDPLIISSAWYYFVIYRAIINILNDCVFPTVFILFLWNIFHIIFDISSNNIVISLYLFIDIILYNSFSIFTYCDDVLKNEIHIGRYYYICIIYIFRFIWRCTNRLSLISYHCFCCSTAMTFIFYLEFHTYKTDISKYPTLIESSESRPRLCVNNNNILQYVWAHVGTVCALNPSL